MRYSQLSRLSRIEIESSCFPAFDTVLISRASHSHMFPCNRNHWVSRACPWLHLLPSTCNRRQHRQQNGLLRDFFFRRENIAVVKQNYERNVININSFLLIYIGIGFGYTSNTLINNLYARIIWISMTAFPWTKEHFLLIITKMSYSVTPTGQTGSNP